MTGILAKQISAIRGVETGRIKIDTDAAGLYPCTPALVTIDGKPGVEIDNLTDYGVDVDKKCVDETDLTYRTWAIYPTKQKEVWYQVLGNMNPKAWLEAHGIDPNSPVKSKAEAYELISKMTTQFSAPELETIDLENGFCGQTIMTPKHWRETYNGKRLAKHPLINVKMSPESVPVAFPKSKDGDKRPLAGVKVLELARVIAAPALGATLAALGADVIKAQSPHLHDLQPLSLTLTAGKRTCSIDMNDEADRAQLEKLFSEADVIISAFRLGSLERKGFGPSRALEAARKRGKGIVYLELNTYGPDGYYAERPGYQQIADAASGCTYVTGKSLGYSEGVGVLPPLPIADMLCGAIGAVDVLLALRDRAIKGGSYHCFAALTSVDTLQVTQEVGLYPREIVDKIQASYKFGHMGPEHHVGELLSVVATGWTQNAGKVMTRPGMFNTFETAWGKQHSLLAPIVKFENEAANPRWDHGPVPYCTSTREEWA